MMITPQHEQSMDSSAGSTTTDRSSNLSCSPTPPKSALTPPSIGGSRRSASPVAIGLNTSSNNNNINNNNNNNLIGHHGNGGGGSGSNNSNNNNNGGGRISRNSPTIMVIGPHQLSPPHVSTANSSLAAAARLSSGHHHSHSHSHHPMAATLPPSLGLLNSLSNMVHHSPLDLMSVSHHPHNIPPRSYNSPPPISTTDPTENECKLVDYRGHKVAAFTIRGATMLCLPQAFELFLKHLVGGLHTVYTKLKRLDIVPIVCNVEQVRILRGLGAIQPGVNRCKLLSCKDFDVLYRDCTTARCMMSHKATDGSRPGRPPKRASSVGLSIAASHLSQLKKHRENGDYMNNYENGHLSSVDGSRLEKSPLLANGYNHPPTHLNHMQQFMQFNHHPAAAAHAAAALLSHQGLPPPPHPGLGRPQHDPASLLKGQPLPPATMDALTRSGIWENCRAAYEDIVKHLERLREDQRNEPDRILSLENKPRDLSSHNGSSAGHSPVLNLSKNGGDHSGSDGEHTVQEEPEDDVDSISENEEEEDEKDNDLSDNPETARAPSNSSAGGSESASQNDAAINYSGSAIDSINNAVVSGAISTPATAQDNAISSTETLLRNIQGLLKVAADNARQQERQISYEKAELKMDVLREREVKESLERQLSGETKIRLLYEKRYKKERRVRKHVQEQLELEVKRRTQLEEAIKTSCTSAEALHVLSAVEYSTNEREKDKERDKERERSGTEHSDSSSYSNSAANAHQLSQPPPSTETANEKAWNYSSIDLINSGAAFWQNYSETLAQELELERKSRHQHLQQQSQHVDGGPDSKSSLQDSRSAANYYKNSVLFSTAT